MLSSEALRLDRSGRIAPLKGRRDIRVQSTSSQDL